MLIVVKIFNIFWTDRIGQFKYLEINKVKKTAKHLFHVKIFLTFAQSAKGQSVSAFFKIKFVLK